jgi:hypothetical protein
MSDNDQVTLCSGKKKSDISLHCDSQPFRLVLPVIALSRFIGVVEGLLTPIDKKWHSLKPKDPTLLENKDVQDWFYTVNELLSFTSSNVATISTTVMYITRSTLFTTP